MPNPRLASRYAKSLLDLARETGELETVFGDMSWLKSVTKTNRDFVNLLKSPVIASDKKISIIKAVAGTSLGKLSGAFITLLIKKGRESHLPEIANSFVDQYKRFKNIHIVKLTTATPLSSSTRETIIQQVKKSAGYENIELEEKVNADIIGGFVLQIGDKLVDASIAYDLKAIAKQFQNNDFIYKVR
jgi:F-type H+-transporting ATPase subunit delta